VSSPAVSVIIPTFNRAEYLQHAIASVLGQGFSDFELIVSDNASTDGTTDAVADFDDPRVRYLRQERNIGMAGNIRAGYEAASGTAVAYLFDDDFWSPTFLAKVAGALLAEPDAVLAFSTHWVTTPDGEPDPHQTEESEAAFGRSALEPGCHRPFVDLAYGHKSIPWHASVFERGAVDVDRLFDVRAGSVTDLWALTQLSLTGRGAVYVPERLMFLRGHEGMETAKGQERMARGAVWCHETLLGDGRVADRRDQVRENLAAAHLSIARCRTEEGDRRGARKHWREARKAGASGPRTLFLGLLAAVPASLGRAVVRLRRR
jgi:Glycosyl transferase family 2